MADIKPVDRQHAIITVTRYHDFSAAHRDHLDRGKCGRIHGHNYRVHFTVAAPDAGINRRGYAGAGFGDIKDLLCHWLEKNWDHRLLLHTEDPAAQELQEVIEVRGTMGPLERLLENSVVPVPFNPTTEAMAHHLLTVVGPEVLHKIGAVLVSVEIEETRKCRAKAITGTGISWNRREEDR